MVPASFHESNDVLDRPVDMTDEQCEPLSIMRARTMDDVPVLVSCWKLTPEELAEVNRTGRVWLVVCGETMPPVILDGRKPFQYLKEPEA